MQNPPKHPPHSVEAEMSTLGGIMIDNRMVDDVSEILQPHHFYIPSHQTIFEALLKLAHHKRPLDFITLSETLRNLGKLEEVGGVSYLGSLVNDTPSAANVLHYAQIVKERALLREMIIVGSDISQAGFKPDGRTAAEILDTAEQLIGRVRESEGNDKTHLSHISEFMDIAEKEIERASKLGGQLSGLSTGLVDLDNKTTGMHPGELWVLAGRPGMGKTSLGMNIAETVAIELHKPVALFTMEMRGDQMAQRLLASFGRIDMHSLRGGTLSDMDWGRMASASSMIREAPIEVDERAFLTPMMLRAKARRFARKHGQLAAIVVDYLQLMSGGGKHDNREQEVASISKSLKQLAKELHTTVILLSQLSRGVEARENKRPRMSDLRESGAIEQDADVVAFVYRDEYYNPDTSAKGIAEIIIGKQRNGPTGTVKAAFYGQYTRFDNLAQGYDEISTAPEGWSQTKRKRSFKSTPPPPVTEPAGDRE